MGSNWDAGKPNEKWQNYVFLSFRFDCGWHVWDRRNLARFFSFSTPLSQKHKYKQLPTAPSHQNKKQYGPYYESLLDAGYFHLSKD